MNNINRDYIFNLRDSNIIIPKLKPSTSQKDLNQTDLIQIVKPLSPLSQIETKTDIIVGPTGPQGSEGSQGLSGDRYCSKTIVKHIFDMKNNSFIGFNIETGLAYISGNSVIVAEVPTKIDAEINSFEGTIQYYNSQSGQIIIKNINNIKDTIEKIPAYYYINLNAVLQPISSSDISSILIVLNNNTINISEQDNNKQYYRLNLKNNDELKYIYTALKNNQKATILIKLDIISNETTAIIYPILNMNTNYKLNIILNTNTPYAILKIHVIENIVFGECISYFKNI
jgi:hypothetical protein